MHESVIRAIIDRQRALARVYTDFAICVTIDRHELSLSRAHRCRKRVLEQDWDGFWYIYRRDDATPSYSHIGIDTAATLNKQEHVAAMIVQAIEVRSKREHA